MRTVIFWFTAGWLVMLIGGCPLAQSPAPSGTAPVDSERVAPDVESSVDAATPGSSVVDGSFAVTEPSSPEPDLSEDAVALLGDCDRDGLSDLQEILAGTQICDARDGPDIDADGVPNQNDDDIDGDGLPNAGDDDVDGDGLSNGQDPDVDGDGVANGDDVDIDGDFFRNRWDFDIDGDGALNLFDSDADADGHERDPAEQEDPEPDEGSGGADPEEEETVEPPAPDAVETTEDDRGPTDPESTNGLNVPPGATGVVAHEPTQAEIDELNRLMAEIFDVTEGDIEEFNLSLERADRAADDAQVLDVLIDQAERALRPEDPAATDPVDATPAWNEMRQRGDGIADLTVIEPGVVLLDLAESLNRLFDTSEQIDEEVTPLVETAVALGQSGATRVVIEAAEVAVDLVVAAHESGMRAAEVPPTVPSVVRTARELPGEDQVDAVWLIVTTLIADLRDDNGVAPFEPLPVTQMIERASQLIGDPTFVQLEETGRNILRATIDEGLSDPLVVLEAVERTVDSDIEDGVDIDEARAAAQLVESEQQSGGAMP